MLIMKIYVFNKNANFLYFYSKITAYLYNKINLKQKTLE